MSLAIFFASSRSVIGPVGAGHERQAERLRGRLRLDLVAHEPDMLGARTDKGDLVLFEDFGEAGILGEEAVARMHGVGAGDLAGRDDLRNVEIAVLRRRARRCTRSHRQAAHAWRRRRPWSGPRRWRCRAPCRHVRCEARSLPGWRSGSCRTCRKRLAPLDDGERLGIFDGLTVIDQDGKHVPA